jgi:apolipoprotein N-acyltransferase
MIALVVALASGVMFYLSQGLDNVWALAWFAPVPLLWLAYGNAPLWQVVLASMAAILAGDIYALQCYYGLLPPAAFLLVIGPQIILFASAVFFARFVERRAGPFATLLAFPACWTAFEFLSESVAPNGTFDSMAYSQISSPVLIQSVSLFGLYAVTFVICLFANTLAMAVKMRRKAAMAAGAGFAVCAANAVFGLVQLSQPQPQTVRVAAMVDETAMRNSWHARTLAELRAVSEAYAVAIRSAAAQGAKFAVTPEGGIAVSPPLRSEILAPLFAASRQTGTQVIAGLYQSKPSRDFALSIRPDGTAQEYDKRHLVPMLENMFTPGQRSGWLGHGRAMEICKDMDFPDTVRRDASDGVHLLGTPAGDFGKDAWLHGRMAIMRGVENGFALVRAANSGLVTASDAKGRIVAAKIDAPVGLTMIVADLPLGPGPTLYTRIGDAFAWFCLALLLLIGAYARFRVMPMAATQRYDPISSPA